MIKPIYSTWLAAYLIVLQQLLMFAVGVDRTKKKQGTGFQNDITLERIVRRRGNLAENAGIFIASITLLELQTGSTRLVWRFVSYLQLQEPCMLLGFPPSLDPILVTPKEQVSSF